MSSCTRCGHALESEGLAHCPLCGLDLGVGTLALPPVPVQNAWIWIKTYFQQLSDIVFRPSQFFRQMPLSGGFTQPLVFALVTHWVGAALSNLWKSTLLYDSFAYYLRSSMRFAGSFVDSDGFERSQIFDGIQEQIMPWILGTGSVLLDPFATLFTTLFLATFIFIGARIIVTPGKGQSPDEIKYESAVRLVSYSTAPALFAAIPIVGPAISSLMSVFVSIIAARQVYRVDTTRAAIIALFPNLLLFGIILMGLAALVVGLISLVTSLF